MESHRIYVASSWRNDRYDQVIEALRTVGHQVYDWRQPDPNWHGFHWSEVNPSYQRGEPVPTETYRQMLTHPLAATGFTWDVKGMAWANLCILLLPCGLSAHAEAGWLKGAGRPTFVLIEGETCQAELMYKLFDGVCLSLYELIGAISGLRRVGMDAWAV